MTRPAGGQPTRTSSTYEEPSGMIALFPDRASADRLRVPRGELVDDLHLTLAYLGDDVTGPAWQSADGPRRSVAARLVDQLADTMSSDHGFDFGIRLPVDARVFAHMTFNADGGPDGDRDPCAAYGIGDCPELAHVRDTAVNVASMAMHFGQLELPAQHEPFVPHVTGGYGLTAGDLTYLGPIRFDRLVVALGADRYEVTR